MECTYCKEDIQEGAIKCKHCNSMLEPAGEQQASLNAFEYFVNGFKQYANFSGRARRKEYWFFMLFYVLFMFITSAVDGLLDLYSIEAGIGLFSGLFALGALVPSLAVTVRRLHDINRSGWWMLISFVPLIGAIILLVFLCKDSLDSNKYGVNPKASLA